uniref:DNA ligase n=1 Tax=Schizaphis graminum TaxID=13262 RepID=A0A2S2N965_SCHGA
MPVWEISGAEFSQAEVHTANGISIRFPRVTKIRNDKDWKTATSLSELQKLYEASKETDNLNIFSYLNSEKNTSSDNESQASPEKRKKKMKRILEVSPLKINTETPSKRAKLSDGPLRRLPDLFTGIRVVVPDSISKNTFLRYFIAYGGTHLNTPDESPTHVIVPKKEHNGSIKKPMAVDEEKKSSRAIAVCAQWFWDSIRNGKLLPTENYQ